MRQKSSTPLQKARTGAAKSSSPFAQVAAADLAEAEVIWQSLQKEQILKAAKTLREALLQT